MYRVSRSYMILRLWIGEDLLKKSTAKLTLTGFLRSDFFTVASYSTRREDKMSRRNHVLETTLLSGNDVETFVISIYIIVTFYSEICHIA